MQQRLFILSQYLLPHHLLSRLIGCAAECKASWFKSRLINWFAQQYQVNMSEAEVEQLDAYEHFNAIFTRALKAGARPLAQADLSGNAHGIGRELFAAFRERVGAAGTGAAVVV